MAKSFTPTLEQTSRMLDLVPFISTHQEISLKSLSEKFGISKKELLDDLNTLWMCGLPGYTPLELIDLAFEDGFVSIRNAEILERPRSLSVEEIVALILGLDLLEKSNSAPQEQIHILQAKLRNITGDVARALPTVDSSHRAILDQAIRDRKSVNLKYFSPVADSVTERIVSPLELQVNDGGEYLLAMTGQGLRTFKLDRVSEVLFAESVVQSSAIVSDSSDSKVIVEIKILSNFRENAETLGVPLESILKNPQAPIQVTGYSSEWFIRAVMASSGQVEVVSPRSIREEIANRSSQLLASYSSGVAPS
jgi:proteasome accessory factor C